MFIGLIQQKTDTDDKNSELGSSPPGRGNVGNKMMLLGFRGCGKHEEDFKVGLAAVKPLPSITISIQTGPGHVHYVPGHPGQMCGSEPLDHLAQVCPAQGDELYSAGSPCGTALLVLRPGCWCPASSASCGLWTGHYWEGAQENRKGGCCWPWSELGPFSPPPSPSITPHALTLTPHQVAALLVSDLSPPDQKVSRKWI